MPRSDLDRREAETDQQHRAFLMWAMQHPIKRSKRRTGIALQVSEKTIRNWHILHAWEARAKHEESAKWASDLYASTYHVRFGGRELRVIEDLLAVEYQQPQEALKGKLAKAVDLADEVSRDEERAKHSTKLQKRVERLDTVADAALVKVGQGIASGKIEAKLSDLGPILRAYSLTEELTARRMSMMPDPNATKNEAGEAVASTSQRVLLAQQRKGDVDAAMEEDAEELLLIIRTRREQARVKAAQAGGAVLPFPDVAEGDG